MNSKCYIKIMTNEELLESIKIIISKEIKEQTDDLIGQMEVFEAKQTYFEQMFRSIIQEQRITKETLGDIQGQLESLRKEVNTIKIEVVGIKKIQKEQGRKINSINKTVDIIGRDYDNRIVANRREIEKLKTRLEL